MKLSKAKKIIGNIIPIVYLLVIIVVVVSLGIGIYQLHNHNIVLPTKHYIQTNYTLSNNTEEEIQKQYPNIQKIDNSKLTSWIKNGCHINGGAITISFDDNLLSTYSIAKPFLDFMGYKAIEAITTNIVGQNGTLSLIQLKDLQNDGWDVVSHSLTHTYKFDSYATVEQECIGSLEWLNDNGFNGNLCYVCPGGLYNSTIIDITHRYYYLIRSVCNLTSAKLPNDYLYPVQYSYSITNPVSMKDVETIIKRAIKDGLWIQFTFHDVVNGYLYDNDSSACTLKNFKLIIDYIYQSGIPVKTYSEVIDESKL